MKTLFILTLVASSALSAFTPLTPNSRLPQYFDNMIKNTLQDKAFPPELVHRFSIKHYISQEYQLSDLTQVNSFLESVVPWMTIEDKTQIVTEVKVIRENKEKISSHLVCVKVGQDLNSALINLVLDEDRVIVQVSTLTDKREDFAVESPFHEKALSRMGFPLEAFRLLGNELKETVDKKIALLRRLLLSSINLARGKRIESLKFSLGAGTGPADIAGCVSAVANAWGAIATNFKTSIKETLVSVTEGKGFTKFQQETTFLDNSGLRLSRYEAFKGHYMTITETDSNPDLKEKTLAWLDLAEFVPGNDVFELNNLFDINKDGKTSAMTVFSALDEIAGKINIMTTKTSGAYTLAPDVFIYEKHKSYAGGIYQEITEKRVYKARSLKEEDIKALTALALTNTLLRLKDVYGFAFKVPSDRPADLCVN